MADQNLARVVPRLMRNLHMGDETAAAALADLALSHPGAVADTIPRLTHLVFDEDDGMHVSRALVNLNIPSRRTQPLAMHGAGILRRDMLALVRGGMLSDMTIQLPLLHGGGGTLEFRGHRAIVLARCPALTSGEPLPAVSREAWVAFTEYLYTDECPNAPDGVIELSSALAMPRLWWLCNNTPPPPRPDAAVPLPFADMDVVTEDGASFRAHRVIFAARGCSQPSAATAVTLPGSGAAFKAYADYMYNGATAALQDTLAGNALLAFEVLRVYGKLPGLAYECERAIARDMTHSEAVLVLRRLKDMDVPRVRALASLLVLRAPGPLPDGIDLDELEETRALWRMT